MEMEFYYSEDREKKRILVDDHLDTREFDFLQNFASDIDEMRTYDANNAEMCLAVINASTLNPRFAVWFGSEGE